MSRSVTIPTSRSPSRAEPLPRLRFPSTRRPRSGRPRRRGTGSLRHDICNFLAHLTPFGFRQCVFGITSVKPVARRPIRVWPDKRGSAASEMLVGPGSPEVFIGAIYLSGLGAPEVCETPLSAICPPGHTNFFGR
jgi:hypothetical protein